MALYECFYSLIYDLMLLSPGEKSEKLCDMNSPPFFVSQFMVFILLSKWNLGYLELEI